MMPDVVRLRFEAHSRLKGFRQRVQHSRGIIDNWLSHCERPYIAFSGGKDSVCVLRLVREQAPAVPAVYLDADNCFPEVSALIGNTPNCLRYPTSEPFFDTLKRFGLEGGADLDRQTMRSTVYEPVRTLLTDYDYDGCVYGIRAAESYGRRQSVRYNGALFYSKQYGVWQCQPLGHWTYDDVWAYIVSNNVPYAGTYDKMWDMPEDDQRVSYWAGETKRRWGRYAWLKRNYPELWNKLAAEIPEVRQYV
jgi:3'-phosphoadenosine 5'-phosphosulfate sulfotransferase (PAPS reductase)/FAD synthetase